MRVSLFLLSLIIFWSQPGVAMELVAHRGASHLAPENTLPAYDLAWKLAADAAECDVHLTADGRVVVIHDPDTARTAGRSLVVADSPYESLAALDVGASKGPAYAGTRIPLLSALLAALPSGKTLLVEIKSGPEILDRLLAVIRASGKQQQLILMSFDLEVISAAKERLSSVPALFLKDSLPGPAGEALAHDRSLIALAKARGLDGLGLHHGGVDAGFVRAAAQADLQVFVWTVDEPAEARRLEKLGIDGLITNRPGWMRTQMAGPGRVRP